MALKPRKERRTEDTLLWSKSTIVLFDGTEYKYYAFEYDTSRDSRFRDITKFPYEIPFKGSVAYICLSERNVVLELNFDAFTRGKVDTHAKRINVSAKSHSGISSGADQSVTSDDTGTCDSIVPEELKDAVVALAEQVRTLYEVEDSEEIGRISENLQPL